MTDRYRTIVVDPPWPYERAPMGHQREYGLEFMPYRSMPVDAIKALPVGDISLPGAHLYLWTTNRFLFDARDVMRAWGFEAATTLTWCKEPMGSGGGSAAFANTSEFIVWGRKRFGHAIRQRREALGLTGAELERRVREGRSTRLIARWEEDSAWPSPADLEGLAEVLGWNAEDFAGAPLRRWTTTWFQWKRGGHSDKPDALLDIVEQVSPGPYAELFARRARLGWDYPIGDQALGGVAA